MFNIKDGIILGLGIVSSIIANLLIQFNYHTIYISIILLLLLVLFILNKKILLLKYIGIRKIEKSISSGTDTEKLLEKAENNFFLAGRGASRFIEAKNLTSALSKMDKRRPIRFLILKPDTDAPELLSKERDADEEHISTVIKNSIKTIEKKKNDGYNISVKFYDNPQYIPIFRIVCIDDKALFISFYKRMETGKKSFQIELFDNGNDNNLYVAFKEHFEALWATSIKS